MMKCCIILVCLSFLVCTKATSEPVLVVRGDDTVTHPFAFTFCKARVVPGTHTDVIIFDKQLTNTSPHPRDYRPEHGLYLIPEEGLYQFSFNLLSKNKDTTVGLYVREGETAEEKGMVHSYANGDHNVAAGSVFLYLYPNDAIMLKLIAGDLYEDEGLGHFNTLSGVLIWSPIFKSKTQVTPSAETVSGPSQIAPGPATNMLRLRQNYRSRFFP